VNSKNPGLGIPKALKDLNYAVILGVILHDLLIFFEEGRMRDKFRGRDFLSLMDFTRDEILDILEVSYDLKRKWATKEPPEESLCW